MSKDEANWGRAVATLKLSDDAEVRVCDDAILAGEKYVNLRVFVKNERYTGVTKAGIMIPKTLWKEFLNALQMVKA